MFSRHALARALSLDILAPDRRSLYTLGLKPRFRLVVTPYRLRPPGWPEGERVLRVAALADIHACDPWMPARRVEEIVAATNRLAPDLVVLLGDYVSGIHRLGTRTVAHRDWARALGGLEAPLGRFAVLGNHDIWMDREGVRGALLENGISVLENEAAFVEPAEGPSFWLAGLGSQRARRAGRKRFAVVDDLPGTLAGIPDDGTPLILLAHEPDIFANMPDRVSLTLCGHTHGGQVALPFIGRPAVPSRFGARYAYGHVVEAGRHLIVSGGIGCSGIPIRFGVPPEIVLVELG